MSTLPREKVVKEVTVKVATVLLFFLYSIQYFNNRLFLIYSFFFYIYSIIRLLNLHYYYFIFICSNK